MSKAEEAFLHRLRAEARKTRTLANHLRDRLILLDRPVTQIALLGKHWRHGADVLDALVDAGLVVVNHQRRKRVYSLAPEAR